MNDHRLILHVGAPKCGSSALQAALSRRQAFTSQFGERFCYAAVDDECALIWEAGLARRTAQSIEGFVRSADIDRLLRFNRARTTSLADSLNGLLSKSNVILSSESWLHEGAHFADFGLLACIDAAIEVLAYVRPQPEYLNRGWWQWGSWSSATFEQWISLYERSAHWARQLNAWSSVRGVSKVEARLLPRDIISDFFGRLSCGGPPPLAVNRSLPPAALRLMQRHRDLRPHAHFAEIDFVLERAMGGASAPSPWVLPMTLVSRVIAACRDDNLALMTRLSVQDRAAMEADPLWWSASAYQDRPVEAPGPQPPKASETDALAAALARALLESEHEKAMMRTQLASLSERIGRSTAAEPLTEAVKRVA